MASNCYLLIAQKSPSREVEAGPGRLRLSYATHFGLVVDPPVLPAEADEPPELPIDGALLPPLL
jgi:hypothetical protein